MERSSKYKGKWIAALGAAVILAVLLVWFLSKDSRNAVDTPIAQKPVRTLTIASQEGGEVILQAGEIAPAHEVEFSFLVGGRVVKRHMDVGSYVRSGQVLASLESSELNSELKVASAELESAKAASVVARENAARGARLLASDAIAKVQVEVAQAEARAAEERRNAAEALYENARRRVEHATLIASEDGVVTAVRVSAGEVVAPGQPILRIAKKGGVDAVFDLSERVFNAAPTDSKVRVSLLSDPNVFADGIVREISPAADPITRTYRVKIALQDAPQAMAYGAAVMGKAVIPAASVIKIPASALTSENGAPAVYVVAENRNQLVRLPVTVQRFSEESAYVGSGLQSGQRIVTAGVSKLRPGQTVTLEVIDNEK